MSDVDLIRYISAVTQGHVMLDKGLITDNEYRMLTKPLRARRKKDRSSSGYWPIAGKAAWI
ncbi:MAG: hypothetical protein IKP40_11480 [Clostridia bacterium]|nr:hypothetical protein [Clostridia bacterium]